LKENLKNQINSYISGGNVKKILIIMVLGLFLTTVAWAQAFKIAYINTDKVIAECNDTKEIQRVFTAERQNWEAQIKDLDDTSKQLEADFDKKKLTMTESGKRDATTKIDAKKAERDRMIDEFFGENGKAKQRYQELIEPVTKKINSIIERIAVDENYSLILDVSTGVVLYAKQNMDITDQVVGEMNKGLESTTDKPVQPTTPPPTTDTKTDKPKKK
jgi:outer membrane protein